MISHVVRALAILTVAVSCSGAAAAGEYRHPKGIFTIGFDDHVWSIDSDEDGEFSVACKREACGNVFVGCSSSSMWVPFGNVRRLAESFDAKGTERAQLEEFATQKAIAEKDDTDRSWEAKDFPPQVVQPYMRRDIDTHPFFEAEFRVSISGNVTRYVSFSTAARGYSVAFVCHAPEARISDWRGHFDKVMQGFKPVPRAGWLRFLALIGL